MAHQVKVLITNSDNLNSIFGTHMNEGKNLFLYDVL